MIKVEGKKGIYAEIVADSVSENGDRLTTFRLHYPRIIHAEVMTHRMFSRNASSSRAIPVKTILEQVNENPAMPVQFGKNKSGMQDDGEHAELIQLDYVDECGDQQLQFITPEEFWELSAVSASEFAETFADAGYHKQVCNRLLEPYQYMNVIVSMTDIDNFWHLRLHKDADPTFVNLSECMKDAYDESIPEKIVDEDYHLPFIDKIHPIVGLTKYFADDIEITLEEAIKISISLCCQVSYRKSDFSIEKAIKIWDMLVTMNPVHASPLEHVAKPFSDGEYIKRAIIQEKIVEAKLLGIDAMYCGNFRGWIQYRKGVKNENISIFNNWK